MKIAQWYIHSSFWILYILVWAMKENFYYNTSLVVMTQIQSLRIIVQAPFIYIVLRSMIRTILSKQVLKFVSIVVCLLSLLTFTLPTYNTFIFKIYNVPSSVLEWQLSPAGYASTLFEMFMLIGVVLGVTMIFEVYERERVTSAIEKKQIEVELKLLRARMNPHFLFNTLNSIFVLIKIDSQQALSHVLKLSNLLSYQLYEAYKPQVPLINDIKHIMDYVELEKTRQGDKVKVIARTEVKKNAMIAPLIFLPFIENAFKHGLQSNLTKYTIELELRFDGQVLNFEIKNDFREKNADQHQGIGISDVKKRLALIYPQKHSLQINKQGHNFCINLTIQLNET